MAKILDNKVWTTGQVPKITDEEFLQICGQVGTPKYGGSPMYLELPGEYIIIENLPVPIESGTVHFVMLSFKRDDAPVFLYVGYPESNSDAPAKALQSARLYGDPDVVMRKIDVAGVKAWLLEHEAELAEEQLKEIPTDPLDNLRAIFHITFKRDPKVRREMVIVESPKLR